MTTNGYNMIIDRIINRTIEPPKKLTMDELNAWLTGYAKCQNDIVEIINDLNKGPRD